MARPQRKRLKFDEESVNSLLQEIYDDSHNQKAKITRLFTKWETKVKEGGEIQAIGDQIVKVIALEAKNVDQKILLLKFLKEVVYDKKDGGSVGTGEQTKAGENGVITAERRNELLSFVQEEIERKENEKK